MSAPKKIWVEKRGTRVGWTSEPIISKPTDIPYIRADIVDELVEALKLAMPIIERVRFIQDAAYGNNFNKRRAEGARLAHDKARAALAKFKEKNK